MLIFFTPRCEKAPKERKYAFRLLFQFVTATIAASVTNDTNFVNTSVSEPAMQLLLNIIRYRETNS
jgi:hypothetical protein